MKELRWVVCSDRFGNKTEPYLEYLNDDDEWQEVLTIEKKVN